MPRRTKQRAFGGSLAVDYNAAGAYLVHNAAMKPGAGSFTISVWVKVGPESVVDVNSHEICGFGAGYTAGNGGWFVNQYGGQLLVYTDYGGPVPFQTFWLNRANRWVHLTIVCNASGYTVAAYADGELVGGPTAALNGAWNLNGANNFDIASTTLVGPRKGNIARVQYWVGLAMTAAQVAAHHFDDIDPSPAQKVVDVDWSEQTGTAAANTGTVGGSLIVSTSTAWSADVPGCLLRRATQNGFKYSNTLTNAAWTKTGLASLAASPLTHPTRPGAPVWRMTETSVNEPHYIAQLPVGLWMSGKPTRISMKVRGGGGRSAIAWGAGFYFDLNTGEYLALGTNTYSEIKYLGNGWYEVTSEVLFYGATHSIYMANGTNVTYLGNGSYVDICDVSLRDATAPSDFVDTQAYPILCGGQSIMKPEQNLVSASATLSSGLWIKGGGLSVSDRGDGSWDVIDADAGQTGSMLKYALGVPAAELRGDRGEKNYTLRLKVAKTTGGTSATFVTSGLGGMGAYFNTDTGALLASSGCVVEVIPVTLSGIDYWSIAITWKPWGSTAPYFYIYPAFCVHGSVVSSVAAVGTARVRDISFTDSNEPGEAPVTSSLYYEMKGNAQRSRAAMYRHNLALNSANPSASWSVSGASASTPATGVCRVTEDSTNNEHIAYCATTATMPNLVSTMAVIAKAGTKTWLRLRAASALYEYAYFDLANGVVGSKGVNVTGHSIEAVGGGWYLCVMSYKTFRTDFSTDYLVVSPANGDGLGVYLGNGTGYIDFKEPRWTNTNGPAPYSATSSVLNEGTPRGRMPMQNLLNNSENMGGVPWTLQAGSVVTIQPGLGVGGSNAQLLDLTATLDNQGVFQSAGESGWATAYTVGRIYTLQCYMKAGDPADVGKVGRLISPNGGTLQALCTLTNEWQLVTLTEPFTGTAGQGAGLWIRKVPGGANKILVSRPAFSTASGVVPYAATPANGYVSEGNPRGLPT